MALPRFSLIRWLPWLLLAAGVIAFLKWQSIAPSVNYITGTITRGTLEDAVLATGVLGAREFVDIGAQVSGVLQKINVELGQQVKKGDLLAQIDPTVFEARVTEDEASLKNLEAQMDAADASKKLAEQRLTRNRNLLKSDAVSQDELDRSEAEFSRAESAIDSLKAQIEKASGSLKATKASLGYTKIYAPVTGTVLVRAAREGEVLIAGQAIVTIVDLTDTWVRAAIPETDADLSIQFIQQCKMINHHINRDLAKR